MLSLGVKQITMWEMLVSGLGVESISNKVISENMFRFMYKTSQNLGPE